MDLAELEAQAAAALPPHVYDYYRATAADPEVLAEQTAAWQALRHRPRVLRDTTSVDTRITVLGTPVAAPVLVAPMAQQIAADPAGDAATAAAVAAAGSLLGISTNAAVPFAAIAAAGAPWWLQLYVMRDRGLSEALLRRAGAAGASAVILTVDITGLAHPRPTSPMSIEPDRWGDLPEAARLANLTAEERAAAGPDGVRIARDLGFGAIEWIRSRTDLPVIVKGVLRGDDAAAAVDAGAAAVVVSTHGARGLATAVAPARALAEVVDAVDGRAEVYADSGIRSGLHVASALALGARAVFIGRPVLWGLATGGAEGARRVIEGFGAELARAMDLLGAPDVGSLTRDLVAQP